RACHACGGLRAPGHAQGARRDRGQDELVATRTRLRRPARTRRAEPARPQIRGTDTGRRHYAAHADQLDRRNQLRLYMFNTTHISRAGMIGAVLAGVLAHPSPAAAQLDPLLFLKLAPPNVIVAVDTSNR